MQDIALVEQKENVILIYDINGYVTGQIVIPFNQKVTVNYTTNNVAVTYEGFGGTTHTVIYDAQGRKLQTIY